MAIVPAVSNDYKLVLCVFPLAVLAVVAATMKRTARSGLGRAVRRRGVRHDLPGALDDRRRTVPAGSKYTLLVALQVLLLAVVPVSSRPWGAGVAGADAVSDVSFGNAPATADDEPRRRRRAERR